MSSKDFLIGVLIGIILFLIGVIINSFVEKHYMKKYYTRSNLQKHHKHHKHTITIADHKVKITPVYPFEQFKKFCHKNFPGCSRLSNSTLRYIVYTSTPKLMHFSNRIRKKYGLVELPYEYYLVFLLSWIQKESSFNKLAWSNSNALGLLQVKYEIWCPMYKVNRSSLFNPRVNLSIALDIFRKYLERSRGRLQHALASYNAGPKNKHYKQAQKYALEIMRKSKKLSREIYALKSNQGSILAYTE